MPRTGMVASFALFIFVLGLMILSAPAQETISASQNNNDSNTNNARTMEGTVVSRSRSTLVIRTDDNQFVLFTYGQGVARASSIANGARVRVTAGAPDEQGTRVASDVTVVSGTSAGGGQSSTGSSVAPPGPVPQKVHDVESDIRRESRRWALGVRAGAAFDPELFTFGVQSRIGPIFHPRFLFRPNAEFAFGEVTDLISLNLEGIYQFSSAQRRGNWTPYVGAGPALIFLHQNFQQGRDIDFGNFDYETGFNILAGMQSRRGTFVELKSSLWSGPAPKFRVIVGYNF